MLFLIAYPTLRQINMADPIAELKAMSVEERSKLKWNDPRLDYVATELEKQFKIPEGVIRAIKFAENTGFKNGKVSYSNNDSSATSSAGATGIMQFTKKTMSLGFEHNPADPIESMNAAAKLLSQENKRMKGNWAATFAQYNGGTSQGKLVMAGKLPKFKETADYLEKIKTYYKENTKGR